MNKAKDIMDCKKEGDPNEESHDAAQQGNRNGSGSTFHLTFKQLVDASTDEMAFNTKKII